MATFQRESALIREVYEQLRRDYPAKYLVLAKGKFLGAAGTFDAACALAQRLGDAPEYYLVFPAEKEPSFDLDYDL
jgi:hypothetical protein